MGALLPAHATLAPNKTSPCLGLVSKMSTNTDGSKLRFPVTAPPPAYLTARNLNRQESGDGELGLS